MEGHVTLSRLDIEPSTLVRPYASHWYDYLVRWVERLPGPYWLFYLGLGLTLFLIETLIQWRDGRYPVGTLTLFHLVWCFIVPYFFGFGHHFLRTAVSAFVDFKPVMAGSEEEIRLLHYQMTHVPLWPGLLANAVGVLVGLVTQFYTPFPIMLQMLNISGSGLSLAFNYLLWLAFTSVAFGGMYVLLRQLVLTNRVYTHYTRVNLFKLIPLYGFARLGASSAVWLLIFLSAYYATSPAVLPTTLPGLAALSFVIPLALVMFISPLLGIHRLLVKEKERLLARNAEMMEAAIAELHHHIQQKDMTGIDALHKAIESLDREQKLLKPISTWPWSPETLRGVLAAVLLPVIVWTIQWVLQRILGP